MASISKVWIALLIDRISSIYLKDIIQRKFPSTAIVLMAIQTSEMRYWVVFIENYHIDLNYSFSCVDLFEDIDTH